MMNFFCGLRQSGLLFAVLVALLASSAWGDDRIAKAVFVEAPKDAPEKVFLVALEQKAIEIPLPTRTFSEEVVLPAGDLVLAVLPRTLAEGEAVPEGAPKLTIPKNWSRCYLLFVMDKGNKVFPVKVLPIDGSPSKFPLGHSRIVNLSEAMTQGKFGKEVVTTRPGQIGELGPPINEFGPYEVAIDFLMKGDEKSQPLTRTNWQHNPRSRQVVLITKPAGVKFPRIRALQDRVRVEVEN